MSEKETQQGNRFFGRALGWKVLHFDYLKKPHDTVSAIIYVISFILILYLLAFGLYFTFVIPAKILLAVNSLDATQSVDATKTSPADSINKLLLGLGGILAVPFLIWRTIISDKQNRIATRQAIIAQDNLHTTTMANAVEHLGAMREIKKTQPVGGLSVQVAFKNISEGGETRPLETIIHTEPNIEVRLGGIYLLEKIAREYEELYWPIIETLCAYIRENTGYVDSDFQDSDPNEFVEPDFENPPKAVRVDIQAAINVIGRRSMDQLKHENKLRQGTKDRRQFRLDLTHCKLSGANFVGLNFEFASFDYSELMFCRFEKTNISHSTFVDANLSFCKMSNIYSAHASFQKANFQNGTISDSRFENCNFEELNGSNSHIYDSIITSQNLEYANLSGAHISKSHFSDTSMTHAKLYNVQFSMCEIFSTDFSLATLNGTSFSESILITSWFEDSKGLTNTTFQHSWLNPTVKFNTAFKLPEDINWWPHSDYEEQYKAWSQIK